MKEISDSKIFRYSLGGKEYFADPLMVVHRLNQGLAGDDADVVFKKLTSEDDSEFGDAAVRMAPAAAYAFRVPLLDEDTGVGVTTLELVELIFEFFVFMSELKKSIGSPPNGSPISAGPPPPPGVPPEDATGSAGTTPDGSPSTPSLVTG